MAKKCWTERNKRKQRTVAKYAELRRQLKAEKDYEGLSMLPRDASPTRLANRCEFTGRRRGYYRQGPQREDALVMTRSLGAGPGA